MPQNWVISQFKVNLILMGLVEVENLNAKDYYLIKFQFFCKL